MDESSRVLTLGLAAPDGLFSQVGAASPLRTDTFSSTFFVTPCGMVLGAIGRAERY